MKVIPLSEAKANLSRYGHLCHDEPVIELNREAMRQMRAHVELEIVPGATHLFEEPGTLEQVAALAAGWFTRHLRGGTVSPRTMEN